MVFRLSSTRKLTLVSVLLILIAVTVFLIPYISQAAAPTNRATAHTQLGNGSANANNNSSLRTGAPRKVASANDGPTSVYTWGWNNVGQLGNGTAANSNTPVMVNLPTGVIPTAVTAGSGHNLAIGSDGKLYAWGDNEGGELGNGSNSNSTTPLVVSLPSGVVPTAIAGGTDHSLAIGSDGKLYAWGWNVYGELGNGSNANSINIPVVVSLPGGVTPTAIAAAGFHSMAIGSDGKLYAWGINNYGELGNGGISPSNIPVVANLPSGVVPTAIAAGYEYSMAIGNNGKLYAWGENDRGQLGNGSSITSGIPVVVSLPSGVVPTAVTAGDFHSLAIGSDGKLYAWGSNFYGQLGNDSSAFSNTPVVVNLPGGVAPTAVTAGSGHSLAIGSDEKLYAWGDNTFGQLGIDSNTASTTPVVTSLPGRVHQIAAGAEHSMIIGDLPPSISLNNVSQAEGNSGTTSFVFTATLSYASNLTTTVDYATSDGTATAPSDYTAATGTLTFSPGITTQTVTVLVHGDTVPEANKTFKVTLSNPTSMATLGTTQAIGTILNDDPVALYAWGYNHYGQLGNDSISTSPTPVVASLPNNAFPTALAAGQSHSLAIGSDGKLYAWGSNGSGQLGDGSISDTPTPVVVSLPAGISPTALAAGDYHSLAIGSDGKLYAWGYNQYGQLGDGTNIDSNIPVVVSLPGGVTPTAIATGAGYSLAIGSDGKLYAWGWNNHGQLGNGTTTDSNIPVVASLPDGVSPTAIAAGYFYGMVIGSDNKLYTWGQNPNGQLGNGTTTDSNIPAAINLPNNAFPTTIAAGWYHSLAIGSDGKLYTWGWNVDGQLGEGTTTDSHTPVAANLPDGVTPKAIAGGAVHSLAIGSDGKLYAWGWNQDGELGNGSYTESHIPVVVNLPDQVFQIAAGYEHNMAIGSLPPSISLNNVSQAEGNSGTSSFVFTATLSYASNLTATVDYATSDGTAIAPDDYTAITGTLTFSPGITTQTFAVPVVGDTNLESDETFMVTLSNATGTATISTTHATGTILNDDATVSLTSSPNPAAVSQPVTFTATVSPIAASGTVTFSEGATVLGTVSVASGVAVYTTSTLSIGSHVITATYSGDSTYGGAVSQPITQVVACPLVVTATIDDGAGTTCGTLSYALIEASPGVTVTFALSQGNTITFTGSLTTTAKVKSGVTLYGGAFGSANRVIINGNSAAGDGLHLAGNNYLYNLTIKKFGGKELTLEGPGNHFKGVVVDAS